MVQRVLSERIRWHAAPWIPLAPRPNQTYCSWLKGDERGFRAKHHEIHSSGNYKNPPPKSEHEGLRHYFAHLKKKEIRIEMRERPIIGRAILNALREHGIKVLAIAVAKVHAHIVPELPDDMKRIRAIIGDVKRKSSRAVKDTMPGKVWSRGEHAERVVTKDHLICAWEYVLFDQGATAWTWSFRNPDDEGMFGRKPPKGYVRRAKSKRR